MKKKTKKASVIAADVRKEIEERIHKRTPVISFMFDEEHPRVEIAWNLWIKKHGEELS